MTPADFRAGREVLGLTQAQIGEAFGARREAVVRWEASGPPPLAARYMTALLSGWRPDDWPK